METRSQITGWMAVVAVLFFTTISTRAEEQSGCVLGANQAKGHSLNVVPWLDFPSTKTSAGTEWRGAPDNPTLATVSFNGKRVTFDDDNFFMMMGDYQGSLYYDLFTLVLGLDVNDFEFELLGAEGEGVRLIAYNGESLNVSIPTIVPSGPLAGETVLHIGDEAFRATSVQSIELPDSVTHIGESAFRDCSDLSSFSFGTGVTHIGDSAFRNNGLGNITFPDNLTHIGDYAFSEHSLFGLVYFPNSVTNIGEGAFAISYYQGLWAIRLPPGLTEIKRSTFSFNQALEDVIWPTNLHRIGDGAFSDTFLERVTLPDGLVEIGSGAFIGSNIASGGRLVIPGSVKEIESNAFDGCRFKSVSLPKLESIEVAVFANNIKLESITIPSSVTNIRAIAFVNCWRLTSVEIQSSQISINPFAFEQCTSLNNFLFWGDAPEDPSLLGPFPSSATVYHRYSASGWGNFFSGMPTAIWPEMAGAAITSGGFGFDIIASEDQEVIVEARSDLMTGAWTPISTNTVPAGELLEFIDPEWDTDPSRFYRIVLP